MAGPPAAAGAAGAKTAVAYTIRSIQLLSGVILLAISVHLARTSTSTSGAPPSASPTFSASSVTPHTAFYLLFVALGSFSAALALLKIGLMVALKSGSFVPLLDFAVCGIAAGMGAVAVTVGPGAAKGDVNVGGLGVDGNGLRDAVVWAVWVLAGAWAAGGVMGLVMGKGKKDVLFGLAKFG